MCVRKRGPVSARGAQRLRDSEPTPGRTRRPMHPPRNSLAQLYRPSHRRQRVRAHHRGVRGNEGPQHARLPPQAPASAGAPRLRGAVRAATRVSCGCPSLFSPQAPPLTCAGSTPPHPRMAASPQNKMDLRCGPAGPRALRTPPPRPGPWARPRLCARSHAPSAPRAAPSPPRPAARCTAACAPRSPLYVPQPPSPNNLPRAPPMHRAQHGHRHRQRHPGQPAGGTTCDHHRLGHGPPLLARVRPLQRAGARPQCHPHGGGRRGCCESVHALGGRRCAPAPALLPAACACPCGACPPPLYPNPWPQVFLPLRVCRSPFLPLFLLFPGHDLRCRIQLARGERRRRAAAGPHACSFAGRLGRVRPPHTA